MKEDRDYKKVYDELMEDRKEYVEAIKECIGFLENDGAGYESKFEMLKRINNCLLNDIQDIIFKYKILKEHVDDIQETLAVITRR